MTLEEFRQLAGVEQVELSDADLDEVAAGKSSSEASFKLDAFSTALDRPRGLSGLRSLGRRGSGGRGSSHH